MDSDGESTEPDTPSTDKSSYQNSADQSERLRTGSTFALTEPSSVSGGTIHVQTQSGVNNNSNKPKSHHRSGTYLCPECGKALSRLDALARHRRSRHSIGRQYYCQQPHCNRKSRGFGRFDNFKTHMETSHGIVISSADYAKQIEAKENTDKENVTKETANADKPDGSVNKALVNSTSNNSSKQPDPAQSSPAGSKNGQTSSASGVGYSFKPATITFRANNVISGVNRTGGFSDISSAGEGEWSSFNREEILGMLRVKIRECESLRERCRFLTLERDEYAEALQISERMREQQKQDS